VREVLTDKANQESGPSGPIHDTRDHGRNLERGSWILKFRIPGFLKRLVPLFAVRRLRELKGRAVSREFPRDIEFVQSPEDGKASSAMSVVVAIHDAPVITRHCLASLERYAPEAEVILVDDGSELIETSEVVREFSGRDGWKVIRHEKALGHSEACRAGASMATRTFLCLLNSDTVVTPWCWRKMKEVFEKDQKIGVAGPSTSVASTGQALNVAAKLTEYWNDNQICAFAERLLIQFEEPVEMDLPWVSGFAFFIRRSLWQEFGGFDQGLPDYGNEFELCSRVAEKGYRIVWIRDAYIHHFGGHSYGQLIGDEGIRARVQLADTYIKQKRRSGAL
jgi:GT2 family glycosyltransferase